MLLVNSVYRLYDRKYRILKELEDSVVVIDIDDEKSFPELRNANELIRLIESFDCELIEDPYTNLISEKPKIGSKKEVIRDKNYELIKPIISHEEYYIPNIRSKIINTIINEKGTTKQTLYRLIRSYWKRGQVPNALLPLYKNSGAKGKKRIAKEKKLGRPRIHTEGIGALVNEDTHRLFNLTINQFLLNDKGITEKYAYIQFKKLYKSHNPNVKETEIPTIWQFKHYYHSEFTQKEKVKHKTNKIIYNKDVRQLKSTVNANTNGPGTRYEIDATIADIYLLSDSDRRSIVGRPIIYLVVDSFSRMVAGLYIGFENPSYATSLLAFKMAVQNKTDFCKKFEIDITEDDWPCIGLPEVLTADRGELLTHQAEALEKILHIRIENTPAYRGDLKPIVERYFRTIQTKFKSFVQGEVTGVLQKKRGGKDYRLDATLTITEFTEIILRSIIHHNNTHVVSGYDKEADFPSNLPAVPINIWNWGIVNRTGKLRNVSDKILNVAFLPRKKATLSDYGLKLFGMYYHCNEMHEKGWFHRKNKSNRPSSIEVAYDLINVNIIYVFYNQTNLSEYWEATLSERSREFNNATFYEVWEVQKIQKKAKLKHELAYSQANEDLDSEIQNIIKKAEKLKPKSNQSKRQRISSINTNRERERERERNERKNSKLNHEGNNKIIQMPNTNRETPELTEEELLLKFPNYHNNIFDDD